MPGGGAQWTATADEFPISTTLSVSVLEIEPCAMNAVGPACLPASRLLLLRSGLERSDFVPWPV